MFAFVGTFSKTAHGGVFNGRGDGVHAFKVNATDGSLEAIDVTPLPDPTFLAIGPSRRELYAASHSIRFEGEPGAGVTAFAVKANGQLTRLNATRIPHPHVTMIAADRSGRHLLAASSLGGAITVLPIETDGRLGPVRNVAQMEGKTMIAVGEMPQPQNAGLAGMTITRRPEFGATNIPHCVYEAVTGGWLLVADYGASGIAVLRFDPALGVITDKQRFPLSRKATPRMLALHPNGRIFYSVNELESRASSFSFDAESGAVAEIWHESTLPVDADARNTASGIAIHPDGRFLWISNRGHDSIATFAVDGEGSLELRGHVPSGGQMPWNLSSTPDGRWLYAANTVSGTLAAFAVDRRTGTLTPAAVTPVPSATSCVFLA